MKEIISFVVPIIIFIAVLGIIYIIYGKGVDKGEQSLHRHLQDEERNSEESERFIHQGLLYRQFKDFIIKIFNEREKISKKDLHSLLLLNFPYYKNGDPNELEWDLRKAALIEHEDDDFYTKGEIFGNLIFTHPEILEFLKNKCQTEGFLHDMWSKHQVIENASMHKIINKNAPLKEFIFGACLGTELKYKLKTDLYLVDPKEHYLYACLVTILKYSVPEPIFYFKDYVKLEKNMDFDNTYNTWFNVAIKCI